MFDQRIPSYVEQFEGQLYKVTTSREISDTDYQRFKYDRGQQNLEEITGLSRTEMPKHSTWIYTSSPLTFAPGDKCKLQHMKQQLKVKMQTPDVRNTDSFLQGSITNEIGCIARVVFFE